MISNILEKKTLRLDIYLYYIRIFKSRSIATKFVLTNRLRISGQVTQKPHKMISVGDVLTMIINNNIKILKVLDSSIHFCLFVINVQVLIFDILFNRVSISPSNLLSLFS